MRRDANLLSDPPSTSCCAVLFEDESIVAVDKPAGVAVIPERGAPLERCVRALVERERGERLWVVHRLDRDTSGVLLFARTADAHRSLSIAFESRRVEKEYDAFCLSDARLSSGGGRITVPLHSARKGKMRPALVGESGALDSETIWRPALDLHTDRGYVTRVRAAPRTGRQHQIRVHLRSIGAPLVVDSRYGGAARRVAGELAADSPAVERLTLHAARLSVDHPTRRGRTVVIESPLPDDLSPLDRWLRAGASRPEDQS